MIYVGIDYHKRYSVVSAVDQNGQRCAEARIDGNSAAGFAQFFRSLNEPCQAVMEACWNWGYLYDLLDGMDGVAQLGLAHPYKTRVIAEAQIKTDKLDARALAKLLRADLIAPAYVPTPATRRRKQLLRQRLFWVRVRTMVRNRVHALVDRQPHLPRPQLTDLFGRRGMAFLASVRLPEPDATLLRQDLEVLAVFDHHVHELEQVVAAETAGDRRVELLRTLPGVGALFSAVLASEIDEVRRFRHPAKLCAYAGLVPTTHASGAKVSHGPLLPRCNQWLRWALVEASWVAIQCSGYFGELYRRQRLRGKNANHAITVVARHLCQIVWHLLSEQRAYQERPADGAVKTFPGRSASGVMEPAVTAAARI